MESMFSLFDSGFGLIPETFISNTDDNGVVSIRVAQHGQRNVRGSCICIQLSNEAAWLADFLMPNDVCNFTGYDATQVPLLERLEFPASRDDTVRFCDAPGLHERLFVRQVPHDEVGPRPLAKHATVSEAERFSGVACDRQQCFLRR
jgi:hypothetical protein